MKFLSILFFMFGSFSLAQQSRYTSPGQGSYTEEEKDRVRRSIHVQSLDIRSEDLAGTWAYSGSGCREPSLDPATHQTESSELGSLTSSLLFIFNDSGEVRLNGLFFDEAVLLREGRRELMRWKEEGNYHLNRNRIELSSSGDGFFSSFRETYLVDGRLIVVDLSTDGLQACGLRHISVLIFNRVD